MTNDAMGQLDLFLGELFAPATKDDLGSMEHPLFSIKKGGDRKIRRYEYKGYFLEITPSVKGAATIWDKDILIYLFSLMRQWLDGGKDLPERFEVSAYDLLTAIGRDSGGKDYSELYAALDRLSGTQIKTNLPTGFETASEESAQFGFALVQEIHVMRDKRSKRLTRLLFKTSDWFTRQVHAEHLLTIDPRYFQLGSGIARRVYELARKHCGRQPHWSISLANLHIKTGSSSNLRRFRFELRELIRETGSYFRAIDYLVILDDQDFVHVYRDDPAGHKALAAAFAGRASVPDTPNASTELQDEGT